MAARHSVAVLVTIAALIPSAARADIKLAVLPSQFGEGTAGFPREAFDEMLLEAAQAELKVPVVSQSDIEVLLSFEKQKELLSCDTLSCYAEMGGALGVTHLVNVRVAKVTADWAVVAKLIDVRTISVISRMTDFVRGGPKELLLSTPSIIAKLAANLTQPLREPPPQEKKPDFMSEVEWGLFNEFRDAATAASVPPITPESYLERFRSAHSQWVAYLRSPHFDAEQGLDDAAFEDWLHNHWYGALKITTSPAGAKVLLDGKPQGTTPLTVRGRGHHSVRISLAGYLGQERKVELAGGRTTTLALTLQNEAELRARAAEVERERGVILPLMWTGLIGGLVFGGAGGGMIGAALAPVRHQLDRTYSDVQRARNLADEQERYSQVQSQIELHNGLLTGGIVAAGVGAGLLALGFTMLGILPSEITTDVTIDAATSSGQVSLRWELP